MVLHKRKIHLNERSSVNPFKCRECRRVFPTSENLDDHIKTLHPSIIEHQPQQAPIPIHPNLENQNQNHIAQPLHHQIHPQFQPIAPLQLGPNFPNFQRLHPY